MTVLALVAALAVWLNRDDQSLAGAARAGTSPTTTTAPEAPTDESTTTSTPLPPDPAVEAVVAELQDYVAAARGRDFRMDVPVTVAADAPFEERVAEAFDIRIEDVIATAAYYEALGLLPEGTAEQYAEQLREIFLSIEGFYDTETGVLVVRGDDVHDPRVQSVIVHELTHAFDDQWFELYRPEYDADRTTEHSMTLTMVAEGDAVRIQNRWILDQPPAVQAAAGGPIGEAGFGASSAPTFAEFGLLSPYEIGLRFMSHVDAAGGEPAVDGVVVDPPETSEQVLFPEVFDRREGRLPIPPPSADGPVIDEGVAGNFFWMGLLTFGEANVAAGVADAAIRGWGGDWQVSWAENDLTCTRTDVEGDTPTDTQELLGALTQWATAHPDVVVSEANGRARMEVCYPVPIVGGNAVKSPRSQSRSAGRSPRR